MFAGVESNAFEVLEKCGRAASWSDAHSRNVEIAISYPSRPQDFLQAGSERESAEATMIDLPTTLDYPIVAIADLHGQLNELSRLVETLENLPEWPGCSIAFLGDFVERHAGVKETIDLVLELLRRPPGGSAVAGNHDLALVRTARLDDCPPSPTGSRAIGPDTTTTRRS